MSLIGPLHSLFLYFFQLLCSSETTKLVGNNQKWQHGLCADPWNNISPWYECCFKNDWTSVCSKLHLVWFKTHPKIFSKQGRFLHMPLRIISKTFKLKFVKIFKTTMISCLLYKWFFLKEKKWIFFSSNTRPFSAGQYL